MPPFTLTRRFPPDADMNREMLSLPAAGCHGYRKQSDPACSDDGGILAIDQQHLPVPQGAVRDSRRAVPLGDQVGRLEMAR